MSEILESILEKKRKEVEQAKAASRVDELKRQARRTQPRNFLKVLQGDELDLLAEIKPKAPSSGTLTDLSPERIARIYRDEPVVSCVSVLTDEPYFGMTLDDFRTIRTVLDKPLLRKEFILDSYQIYRSALAGADAVLLIASVLQPDTLKSFRNLARDLGMQPLVEIHSREEWGELSFQPDLLGINNRTLKGDFSTNLSVSKRLAPDLPDEVTVISESGIESHDDVEQLRQVAGIDGILVGTSLLKNVKSPETIGRRARHLMHRSTPGKT